MKVDGNGQGKILSLYELKLLFTEGLSTPCDRALFDIYLFTGCRVSEALALKKTDIKSGTDRICDCSREWFMKLCGH